jgi:hypothetical protein
MLPRIYAAIDEHRFTDVSAFFAPGIIAKTPGGMVTGHEKLLELLRRNHEGIPALQHLVTGLLIDEHGDEVELRANLVAIFASAERDVLYELGSVWRGRAMRDTEGWLLTSFAITPVWQRGARPTP